MIQREINNLLGTLAASQYIGSNLNEQAMDRKYGDYGDIVADIDKDIQSIDPNTIAKGTNHPLTLDEKESIKSDLEYMKNEARTTDLRERNAKKFGLFPTEKSKAIRNEGLDRKSKNIAEVTHGILHGRGNYVDYSTEKSQEIINTIAEIDRRRRK